MAHEFEHHATGDDTPVGGRAEATGTGERERALLEAVTTIGSDLDLQTVLRRITEAARTLVGAKYGALGVIGERGERPVLMQFITVGLEGSAVPDSEPCRRATASSASCCATRSRCASTTSVPTPRGSASRPGTRR